jgi:ATP-dependent Zn protease
MKKSTKILLGLATIWPVVYMLLFFVTIFSVLIFSSFAQERSNRNSQSIDLIQLEQKIKNGELKSLTIRNDEMTAIDRLNGQEYRVQVANDRTKAEILKQAREPDASGKPRVERVDEESGGTFPTLFPIGFIVLFVVHMFTILLIMALMAFYIVQVVRTDRLDQTMKILWTVLICMVGMGAMPVYWYLYIWREPANAAPAATL